MSDFGEWLGAETCQLCGKGPGHNDGCAMTKQPDTDAIERVLRFHETGGHEGDGSDAALASARTELSDLRNKVAGLEAALLYCAETTTDKHTSRKAFEALSTKHSRAK